MRKGAIDRLAIALVKRTRGCPGILFDVRDASGKRVDVSFKELVDKKMEKSLPRADLHISRTRDGELLLTSRQDGMIRVLVPDGGTETASAKR